MLLTFHTILGFLLQLTIFIGTVSVLLCGKKKKPEAKTKSTNKKTTNGKKKASTHKSQAQSAPADLAPTSGGQLKQTDKVEAKERADQKEKSPENKAKGSPAKEEEKKDDESKYPICKAPTTSQKKKRKDEMEKDKQEKIAQGFYQEKSDEDDTLEQVKSLQQEASIKGGSSKRNKKKT